MPQSRSNVDISLEAYLRFATNGILKEDRIPTLKQRFVDNINFMSSSVHTEESISKVLKDSFTSNRGKKISFDNYSGGRHVNMLSNLGIKQNFISEFNSSRWVISFTYETKHRNINKYKDVHMNHAIFLAFYRKGINPFLMEIFIYQINMVRNRSFSDFDRIVDHSINLSRELKNSIDLLGGTDKFIKFSGWFKNSQRSPAYLSLADMEVVSEKIARSMKNGADREMSVAFALLSNVDEKSLVNGRHRKVQNSSHWIKSNPHDLGWDLKFISNEMEKHPKPKFDYRHVLACIEHGIHADDFRKLLLFNNNFGKFTENIEKTKILGLPVDEFVSTPQSWIESWED